MGAFDNFLSPQSVGITDPALAAKYSDHMSGLSNVLPLFNYEGLDSSGINMNNLNSQMSNWANPQSLGLSNIGPGKSGLDSDGWGFGSAKMGQAIGLGKGILDGAMGIGNFYMGMKNYGLAKDTLKFNKQQYWNNFTSQARLTNAELRDRQQRRYRDNPTTAENPDSYMARNGINEKGVI